MVGKKKSYFLLSPFKSFSILWRLIIKTSLKMEEETNNSGNTADEKMEVEEILPGVTDINAYTQVP